LGCGRSAFGYGHAHSLEPTANSLTLERR